MTMSPDPDGVIDRRRDRIRAESSRLAAEQSFRKQIGDSGTFDQRIAGERTRRPASDKHDGTPGSGRDVSSICDKQILNQVRRVLAIDMVRTSTYADGGNTLRGASPRRIWQGACTRQVIDRGRVSDVSKTTVVFLWVKAN